MSKNLFRKILINIIIIIIIFTFDRFSKLFILNSAITGQTFEIYINSFLNLYLIWNTGVGFGLFSSNSDLYYNSITLLIIIINITILVMILRLNNYKIYFLSMILGGSLGNLFDRIYYRAVPDFIDLHYESFHWFVFNVADIFISLGIICLILAEVFFDKGSSNEKN